MIRDLLRDVTPLQAVGYLLAAIGLVGVVWLASAFYIVAMTP